MALGDHLPTLRLPGPSGAPDGAPAVPLEALEDEITSLAAQLSAATHRLLQLIAEFDRREGWGGWGMRSCAHWLTWKCGIDLVTAREKVRAARSLEAVRGISDAMRRGRLSYSKVRAMSRVATPANEQALLAIALNGTASHVERVCRLYRRTGRIVERVEAVAQHRDRELVHYWDEDGCLVIKGRLPPEQGALVVKALQAADEALVKDAVGAQGASAEASSKPAARQSVWAERQADALTLVAETLLAHGARGLPAGERHLVTVHVDVNALAIGSASAEASVEVAGGDTEEVQCHVHDGPAIARDVMRRFACDASVVALVENERGEVLDVGRKTRTISPALRRALEHRDGGCRFPGCSCTRFVDAHHIEHWADGGETRIDNLVLLCRHHHRLAHEGGFSLVLDRGEVAVRRPDGSVLPHVPTARALREAGHVALQRKHDELDLGIHARTSVPGWGGERADYDYLVAMLADRDAGLRSAASGS